MNQIINWQMSFINQFKKRKIYSSFRANIWGVDLADMQSLSKYNKGNKYSKVMGRRYLFSLHRCWCYDKNAL